MSENTQKPESTNQKPKVVDSPKKNSFHIDWFQFVIALVIIVSFTLFVGKVIWDNPQFDDSFKIISIVAPFVGTIIGFYFGQKPVQNLTQQVASATNKNQSFTSSSFEASEIIESDKDTIEGLKSQVKSLKEIIESLNNDNGV